MRQLRLIILLCCFIMILPSKSETVANLSVGEVPVSAQTTAAVNQAAPAALTQVLIKMSGNPSVVSIPAVSQAVNNASQWMQSFSYVPASDDAASLKARIQFDQHAISTLLRQAHQAVWRANRPLTLVWINVDDGSNNPNPVLSSDDTSPPTVALKADSQQLGLPVVLPDMDLQDQSYLNTDGALPFDINKLNAAGARYKSTSIIAGNLSVAVDGSWQGQWMYVLDGVPHQWDTTGPTSAAVIHQAMLDMDGVMASVIAARDNTDLQTLVMLQINGVTSLDDYAMLMHELKQLTPVAHVDLAQLDGSMMNLHLRVVGGADALKAALEKSQDLARIPQPMLSSDVSALTYQFRSSTNGAPTS